MIEKIKDERGGKKGRWLFMVADPFLLYQS